MLRKTAAVLLVLVMLPVEACACTAICIGSNLTADGSTIFARLEEFTSDEGWPSSLTWCRKAPTRPERSTGAAMCYQTENGTWGVCPEGWRDS